MKSLSKYNYDSNNHSRNTLSSYAYQEVSEPNKHKKLDKTRFQNIIENLKESTNREITSSDKVAANSATPASEPDTSQQSSNPNNKASSKSVSAYDIAKSLAASHPFAVINNSLHIYVSDRRYFKLIRGDEFDKLVRKIVPEGYKKAVNSYMINEIEKWLITTDDLYIDSDISESHLRNYVNFKNGILDVVTGEKQDEIEDFYFTNFVDADYPFDEEPVGKEFTNFIYSITKGDQEIEKLLQEMIGLALSEVRDLKVAIFLYGMPNSGKSLLIQLLRALVGEAFCSNVSLHQISSEPYAIAQLVDKKLNAFAEMAEVDLKRLDLFKTLTGNDSITARQIYQRPFSFRNRALLVFGGNNFPNIKTTDVTNAFFERIQIVPFMHSVPKKKQDPLLFEKLLEEKEYIVHWAMTGLRRLLFKKTFTYSKVADEIKSEYMNQQNSFSEFIESMCSFAESGYLFSYEIENAYYTFCNERHLIPLSKLDIHRILKSTYKLPYKKRDISGSKRNGYCGISFN